MKLKDIFFKEALRSNAIRSYSDENKYWKLRSKKRKIRFKSLVFLPLRLLRLLISTKYWQIYFLISNKLSKKDKFILLTREKGIRNKYSLDDYRFNRLSKKLSDFGSVFFFVHGRVKKINFSFSPRIYSNDFKSLAEFLIFGFGLKEIQNKMVWEQDLLVLKKTTQLISKLITKEFKIFFWDFNTDHCPLLLAGLIKNCKLIGSMHAFTEKGTLPWTEKDWDLANLIKHNFINYKKIFSDHRAYKYGKEIQKSASFKLINNPIHLLLIEEDYSLDDQGKKRYFSIEWASKNRDKFKLCYVKVRKDNAFTQEFIQNCHDNGLKNFEVINDIDNSLLEKIFVVGSYSSFLLELASSRVLCASISDKAKKPFDNPSWEMIDISTKKYISENNQSIQNPINLNTKSSINDIPFKGFKIIPSKACINHIVYRKFIVDILFKEMI